MLGFFNLACLPDDLILCGQYALCTNCNAVIFVLYALLVIVILNCIISCRLLCPFGRILWTLWHHARWAQHLISEFGGSSLLGSR